jgi:EpsI family protein
MKFTAKTLALLALMLLSATLGAALRPRINLADERPPVNLAAMVPTAFADWREELNLAAQVVNPQQRELLEKIYSQTLSRTYVNAQGYRIMLSIAYGKNQSDSLQMHLPDLCYPSQGFTVLATQRGKLDLLGKPIAPTRLNTSLGQRAEPLTYWTTVGDYVIKDGSDKKLAELRYAMQNRIPDGMLVRVSSIDKDTAYAYTLQNQFATAMVGAIAPDNRMRFAGDLSKPAAGALQMSIK